MVIQTSKPIYTAEDIYQFALQGRHYELLNGELIDMAPAKQTHGAVANLIAYLVTDYVLPRKLGVVYAAETGFALSTGDVLAPDVSFTSKTRIQPEADGFSAVAPDLAVEVFSPNNTKTEMQEKVTAYFQAGTRLVWIVYPRSRTIYVYTAPNKVTILQQDGVLDGGDVLVDFHAQVSHIFSVLDD
jgi:Uma2 family endonuclease